MDELQRIFLLGCGVGLIVGGGLMALGLIVWHDANVHALVQTVSDTAVENSRLVSENGRLSEEVIRLKDEADAWKAKAEDVMPADEIPATPAVEAERMKQMGLGGGQ